MLAIRFFPPIFLVFALCANAEPLAQSFAQFAQAQKQLTAAVSVGVASLQGRRSYQEDRYNIIIGDDYAWYAVFDGHGGDKVSQYAADNLHDRVFTHLRAGNSPKQALSAGFVDLNKELEAQEYAKEAGSTAIVALIKDGVITVANLGDSRAVLIFNDESRTDRYGSRALSEDHKPSLEREKKRVLAFKHSEDEQGFFLRGRLAGVLAMTRSLGDTNLLNYGLSNEPEIQEHKLTNNDLFLVLASDGLWDVISNEGIAKALRFSTASAADLAEKIVEDAYHGTKQPGGYGEVIKKSLDNITAIVVKLAR